MSKKSELSSANKLSIYLIKEKYIKHEEILKDIGTLKPVKLENIGVFYFNNSQKYKPAWVKRFFHESLGDTGDFFNASSKGLLLVEVNITNQNKRIFAIPFGYGRHFLEKGVYEERFGLKTTLNIVDPDNLRKIDKKNMSIVPKDTSEQLTKAGLITNFGIDIEQDLIVAITGKSNNLNDFGNTVSGKEALSVSVKRDINSIVEFLRKCYKRYGSDDYKKHFDWIDRIAQVKGIKLLDSLNEELIQNFTNNTDEKTWMAVPEIIEWHDIQGFKYKKIRGDLKQDICIEDFLSSLYDNRKQSLNIDVLKQRKVYGINAENGEVQYEWKVYNCIYSEITRVRGTFLLSNGNWYEIKKEYADRIRADFVRFRNNGCSIKLPSYRHKNEGEYNKKVPKIDDKYCCMDRDLISHGGGRSKIEFCDLITKDKKLIHVKRYGGSSVLSHLFNQGLVSGELLGDEQFRKKVNEKLHKINDSPNFRVNGTLSDYEIIFAIISSVKGDLEIPFFSKVSLLNVKKRLTSYGYKVSMLKIPTEEQADT